MNKPTSPAADPPSVQARTCVKRVYRVYSPRRVSVMDNGVERITSAPIGLGLRQGDRVLVCGGAITQKLSSQKEK